MKHYKQFLIDMDGVLWTGNTPLPGMQDFFAYLRETETPFVLVTNNAAKTLEQYMEKFAMMGVEVQPHEVLSAAMGVGLYLKQTAKPNSTVYVIGEDGIREALADAGLVLADSNADYVAVGYTQKLTWEMLAKATLNINDGATFIGSNPDVSFPEERGFVPGNGATLAAIAAATGVQPTIIGKPEPILYQQAVERLPYDMSSTLAIGDRLETDILGAINADIASLLVMTGVTSAAQAKNSTIKSTHVLNGLPELLETLRR